MKLEVGKKYKDLIWGPGVFVEILDVGCDENYWVIDEDGDKFPLSENAYMVPYEEPKPCKCKTLGPREVRFVTDALNNRCGICGDEIEPKPPQKPSERINEILKEMGFGPGFNETLNSFSMQAVAKYLDEQHEKEKK